VALRLPWRVDATLFQDWPAPSAARPRRPRGDLRSLGLSGKTTAPSFADEHIGIRIFKQGGFEQFIRQAEIDALGLRLPDGTGTRSVIAVDTAFHEGGVNYGSAEETIGRVVKKLIRAALALEAYVDAGDTAFQPLRDGPSERR
jgi:hypothetical protein